MNKRLVAAALGIAGACTLLSTQVAFAASPTPTPPPTSSSAPAPLPSSPFTSSPTTGPTPAPSSSGVHALTASVGQVCEATNTYCINDWGGGGAGTVTRVNLQDGQDVQNAFTPEGVDRCNNGDYTTANCPVSGVPAGLFMYQDVYTPYNGSECIATFASGGDAGLAGLGTCNETGYPGTGGSPGTIQISYHAGCANPANADINSYWTGQAGGWNGGSLRGMYFNSSVGSLVSLDETGTATCLIYDPPN